MQPDRFEIWYADGSRRGGTTAIGWKRAPDDGVQVVIAWPGYGEPAASPWSEVWDRQAWTGLDGYDPFGWGVKRGSKIPDAEYRRIWRKAIGADD